jgi:hypothetical protein
LKEPLQKIVVEKNRWNIDIENITVRNIAVGAMNLEIAWS